MPNLRRAVLEAVVHRLNIDLAPDLPRANVRRFVLGEQLETGMIGVWKHEETSGRIGRSAHTGNASLRLLDVVTQIVQPCDPEEAELANDPAEDWVVSRLADWRPDVAGVHKLVEKETAWETLAGGAVVFRVSTIVWVCELQTLSADLTKAQ